MKPKVYIDEKSKKIKIESIVDNEITITEAHSFLKDLFSILYDYGKLYPKEELGNYIE